MIEETKCYTLLKGLRNILPSDVEAVVDTIMNVISDVM